MMSVWLWIALIWAALLRPSGPGLPQLQGALAIPSCEALSGIALPIPGESWIDGRWAVDVMAPTPAFLPPGAGAAASHIPNDSGLTLLDTPAGIRPTSTSRKIVGPKRKGCPPCGRLQSVGVICGIGGNLGQPKGREIPTVPPRDSPPPCGQRAAARIRGFATASS